MQTYLTAVRGESLNRTSSSSRAATAAPRGNPLSSFAQQFSSAVRSNATTESPRASGMTRSTRQNIVTSEPLRQNPVTPGTGTGTGTTADPGTGIRQISTGLFAAFEYPQGMLALPRPPQAAPATTPAAPAPSTPPVDPMTALTNALTAAGIDAKSLGLTLNEQQCYYPGGAYMNRQISATLPNGTVEKFDAGLVQANPRIAVTELARLMGLRVS